MLMWMYLVVGVAAIAGALFFMSIDSSILDWFILVLGFVSLWQAYKEYRAFRGEAPKS